MKEYRLSFGQKALITVFALVFAGAAVFLIYQAFHLESTTAVAALVAGFLLLGGASLLYLVIMRTRLIIDQRTMVLQRFFSTRTIPLDSIDGYRRGEKGVLIVQLKEDGTRLRLPNGLEDSEELLSWLKTGYPDLDVRDYEMENSAMLADDRYGTNQEERKVTIKKARTYSIVMTGIAFILFIWVMIDPHPVDWVMIPLLVGPLVTLYLVWQSKGLIKINSKRKNAHPSVVIALVVFVLGALFCALRVYSIYLFPKQAWSLLMTGTLLLSGIACLAARQALEGERYRGLIVVFIVLASGTYSYGLLVFANCFYDRSNPEHWEVEVTGKHLRRGKSTSYYLHLSAWGRFKEGRSQSVSRSFYNEVATGDKVDVYLRSGKWGIPWYWIEKRRPPY